MGSGCDHANQPSFAEDVAIAKRALGEGDHKHAAFHAACALALDARHEEALALADRILAAAPDSRALFDLEGEPYFGVVALHARALWQHGDRDEAVEQLANVIGRFPDVGYTAWLASWIAGANAKTAWIALERASRALGDAGDPAQRDVLAAGTAAMRVHDTDYVGAMHGRNLRICGQVDAALDVLGAVDAKHRTYITGVTLATTRKIKGDIAGAVALFEDLTQRFPDDDAVFLDLGDNRLELDRYDDAAAAYQHVVARDPHHDWAYPSLLYAKFLATGDDSWRAKLEDAALVGGANRAKNLARSITPYLGYLPEPPEAVLKVGPALTKDGVAPGGTSRLALSSLEAPSAVRAIRRYLAGYGATLDVSTKVPEPDPRPPRRPVAIATWTYEDTEATPALAAPPAAVTDAIATITNTRFDGAHWLDAAAPIGKELGPGAAADIVAAMLHWPDPPSWASPLTYGFRFQVAAALVLANLDDGWDDASPRRRALMSLIDGPVDWLAAAGLIAITRLCDREPALVPAVTAILEDAATVELSPINHMCLRYPAVILLTQLPGASPSQREARRTRRAKMLASE